MSKKEQMKKALDRLVEISRYGGTGQDRLYEDLEQIHGPYRTLKYAVEVAESTGIDSYRRIK